MVNTSILNLYFGQNAKIEVSSNKNRLFDFDYLKKNAKREAINEWNRKVLYKSKLMLVLK